MMKRHAGPKDVVGMKTAMRPSDATFVFKEGKALGFPMKRSKQCRYRYKKYLISRPTCSPFKAPAERGRFDRHKEVNNPFQTDTKSNLPIYVT